MTNAVQELRSKYILHSSPSRGFSPGVIRILIPRAGIKIKRSPVGTSPPTIIPWIHNSWLYSDVHTFYIYINIYLWSQLNITTRLIVPFTFLWKFMTYRLFRCTINFNGISRRENGTRDTQTHWSLKEKIEEDAAITNPKRQEGE